ncbi:hypothetical protein [Ideonella sp.]|uniref:hypothetical protein n=1 Tax=Ideonella sp. TaxID=1929293 RepID=UPI002B47BE32|nr:hypothetical protein [Ideonella sp.]HJV71324.1 hypothetical protein [Ideonella sp.]
MKNTAPALLLLLSLGVPPGAGAAVALGEASGTYTCSYKLFSSCSSGSATVKLLNGKLQQVSFESLFCATPAKPANRCSLESARGGPDRWSESGTAVRIEFTHPKYPEMDDALAVTVQGQAIVIDFGESQSLPRCDLGADLPEKLTLDPADQNCRVEY